MGRPKGSKNKTTKSSSTKDSSRSKEVSNAKEKTPGAKEVSKTELPKLKNKDNLPEGYEMFSKREYDKLEVCPKCKKKIKTEPVRINTNYICGVVHYHRVHPEHIYLCRDCAKKLSDVVDKWLGTEYPSKWDKDN